VSNTLDQLLVGTQSPNSVLLSSVRAQLDISRCASGSLISLGYVHKVHDQLGGPGRQVLCRYIGSHSSPGLCCFSEAAQEVELASLMEGCFSCCSHCKIHAVFLEEEYFLPERGEQSWGLDVPLPYNPVGCRERLGSPMAQHRTAVGVLGAVYSSGLPVRSTLLCKRTGLVRVQVCTSIAI